MNLGLATLTFDNADPAWFWLLLALGSILVLALTYRGIYQRSGRRLTWLLFALRAAGVAALLIALVKPAWLDMDERDERPKLAVVLDDSQSMSIQHRPTSPAAASPSAATADGWSPRYTQAVRWLTESEAGQSLRERFDVTVLTTSGQELDPGNLPPEPTAEQTDLVRGLRAAAARLRGKHAAGVLLISDGRDTTGRENYLGLDEFPPTYAIGFRQPPPDSNAPFDLAVVAVDAPQRTLVHNAVTVRVLVSKDGGPTLDLPIQIERAGTPLMTQRVELPAGAVPQQMVALTFTPTEPGDFVLAARLPEQPRERTLDNNLRLFRLRVEAEPIRVLYVEGFLRPEYTFLRDRLSGDPDIDLAAFVRAANPEQAGGTDAVAAQLITAERLEKIDVVLLGDFEAAMLDEATYRTLREWVEQGGALMVLGGYLNLGEVGLGNTPLADALPVETMTGPLSQVEEPFRLRLTQEGRLHPALTITGDMARDASLWESLPELEGVVAVRGAKPGATVLARHPRSLPGGGESDGLIVLATQPFGKGTVALITADTTWRWSRLPRLMGRPDTLYVRFWSQMIRWLARRDVQSDRPPLMVTTDQPAYDRGKRVTIRVSRNPAAMVPAADGGQDAQPTTLALAVRAPDGRVTQVTAAQGSDPNQWTATYFPDRGGRFHVDARLVAPSAGGAQDVANETAEFLVHDSALERADPSTSPATLQLIANATGGAYADIDDPAAALRLVRSIPAETAAVAEVRKASVWNSPLLFLVFLGCVTAEWIVRRKHQLV